ncbi:antitoxin [Williamsia sterculiae]|uniref:MT0933-like antitoxin protein n=1 Tax=Williamsia sterculiae TaxID=1344003 RepID=A0A1N7H9V3_9NOCA|nr:antitoxin [Williamsia sterculiae]SIS21636.1 MT0933-like antitoxin protein [Williamsia sterculiae]
MSFVDKVKDFLGKHDAQVDQGIDKAGGAAKQKFQGHDQHIDTAVNKAKDATRPQD